MENAFANVCKTQNMHSIQGEMDHKKVRNLIFTPDYFNTHLLPAPVQMTAQGQGRLLEREHYISKLSALWKKPNNLPLKKYFF